jgi:hypothetical protein
VEERIQAPVTHLELDVKSPTTLWSKDLVVGFHSHPNRYWRMGNNRN